jgi:hypothetical protein
LLLAFILEERLIRANHFRVRREAAEQSHDQDRKVLEERLDAGPDGGLSDGLPGGEGEGHAGTHDPRKNSYPSALDEAELGDDVYGEDPTVNKLERIAAEKMGKEAALFTTSGTQSNLIAVLSQTRHGDEIILGSESHMFWYEVGGAAAVGDIE